MPSFAAANSLMTIAARACGARATRNIQPQSAINEILRRELFSETGNEVCDGWRKRELRRIVTVHRRRSITPIDAAEHTRITRIEHGRFYGQSCFSLRTRI